MKKCIILVIGKHYIKSFTGTNSIQKIETSPQNNGTFQRLLFYIGIKDRIEDLRLTF